MVTQPKVKPWKRGYKLRRDCKNRATDLVTKYPRIPEGQTVEYMLDALVGFVDMILDDFESVMFNQGDRPYQLEAAIQKRLERQHRFEIEAWTQCRNRLGKIDDNDPKAWAKARKVFLLCIESIDKLGRSTY